MDEELKKLLILSTQSIKGLTDSLTKKESVGEANIKAAVDEGSKIWEMSLEGVNVYCNPSVENLAREVFLAMEILFDMMVLAVIIIIVLQIADLGMDIVER